ncbi:MAG: bifunctional phosphoribosylaminoimidazolecarboxamide formyltransferase/IMP cyclohydrolase [Ignavibacteriaceae bacterium]|nr:MAG: bifunctional phosphoribosylaminoimidazolecarboxamide formyltransferase/IMP cyclohydrolase PurH [Chlorobiota bacterium]KXK04546.1 MAG: phosphoribosylaminoimidazolecarboxamide formyltransferase/IMP cyclohydrolase [Chlorobi bacterium OLB4]MBV6399369.1 Bifunctional purine biosynthesis protein PurH [Ignavibacteria bacterium]MCC6886878.1 bifunctional phosphoribosylaminoimidazolecarboxamide formyltransferase/IMP cyclohydrolase [Ignavibacteriales bacterium]MCE7953933.1 bifunctional phosphoribos
MKKRAIVSVYDKTGIIDFTKALASLNVEIISTGGTYKFLRDNGINVKSVESETGFPEILNGRVKTLHPKILGAILINRDSESDINQATSHGIEPIDLVVVNLYPFSETVSNPEVTIADAIEEIDIGGVTLIRAAAKNFKFVDVIVSRDQYADYITSFNNRSPEKSMQYAYKAFEHIAKYDIDIKKYFYKINGKNIFEDTSSNDLHFEIFSNLRQLRYGENPHQKAVMFSNEFDERFEVLHGKELSYNNILDISAAYDLIGEFKNESPACAIIKHGNPSGVAVATDLTSAFQRAFNTDTVSPFGGIIIFNKPIDFNTSVEVDKLFTEIILAPDFDDKSLELLTKKKNRRLIKFRYFEQSNELRSSSGAYLLQQKDNLLFNRETLKVVTQRQPDSAEMNDMEFAFRIVKHSKSNAVVFVKDKTTLGIGCGQPSRIDSTKIAISKAKEFGHDLAESVAASDAFFPFADGLIELAKAGAVAVIQPGGSVRDEEVINAANENSISMVFTGIRHFKH